MRYMLIVTILGALALVGCVKVCKPRSQHCLGPRMQICDKNGKWRTVMDCTKVKPADRGWTCCCGAKGCGCRALGGDK